jgi:hypothetical protein
MFIRERPEEAADIAMKKIPMGNVSRPLVGKVSGVLARPFRKVSRVYRQSKESRRSWNLT